jgi:hypothetical protein
LVLAVIVKEPPGLPVKKTRLSLPKLFARVTLNPPTAAEVVERLAVKKLLMPVAGGVPSEEGKKVMEKIDTGPKNLELLYTC